MLKQSYFKQFSIGKVRFSSIWSIDRTLSSAVTPGQSGPWSDGTEGVLRVSQSSSITKASPSDFLVSYQGHSLVGGLNPLQRSSRCVIQPGDWTNYVIGQPFHHANDATKGHLFSEVMLKHFFSKISCRTKAKHPSLSCSSLIAVRKKWIHLSQGH